MIFPRQNQNDSPQNRGEFKCKNQYQLQGRMEQHMNSQLGMLWHTSLTSAGLQIDKSRTQDHANTHGQKGLVLNAHPVDRVRSRQCYRLECAWDPASVPSSPRGARTGICSAKNVECEIPMLARLPPSSPRGDKVLSRCDMKTKSPQTFDT